jgi:ribonuclease PH
MLADLNYQEDSAAELDANIIMNDRGEFVEIQGTAEKGSFSKGEFQDLLSLAEKSCSAIFEIQQEYLKLWKLD